MTLAPPILHGTRATWVTHELLETQAKWFTPTPFSNMVRPTEELTVLIGFLTLDAGPISTCVNAGIGC